MQNTFCFNRVNFYKNIKQLAKINKLTIKEVSQQIGVSEGYISKIGNSNSNIVPRIDIILAIMGLFDISFEQLICNDQYFNKEQTSEQQHILAFIDKIFNMTIQDELDWKKAKIDEVTNCPQEELADIFKVCQEKGEYYYVSKFIESNKSKRNPILPFYITKYSDKKGIVISGYTVQEDKREIKLNGKSRKLTDEIKELSNIFYELYVLNEQELYPISETNTDYIDVIEAEKVQQLVEYIRNYVGKKRNIGVVKHFFDDESE